MSACRGVWRSAQLRKGGFCRFATLGFNAPILTIVRTIVN